jgi:penicillin-binding protein 1C
MAADVADAIADILSDPTARVAAFGERTVLDLPFRVAVKTGTSKGYRDNWTVGFTREVTVAVWVGNFDGSPMEGVSGISGAGPLFRAVMDAAMRGRAAAPFADLAADGWLKVEICPLSGGAPSHACPHAVTEWMPPAARAGLATCRMHERVRVDRRNGLRAGPSCPAAFVEERAFETFDGAFAAWADAAQRAMAPRAFSPLCPGDPPAGGPAGALRVAFPHDGARFLLDPDRPRDAQSIAIRVDAPAGASRVAVRVDGQLLALSESPFVAEWRLAPGDHVIDAAAPDGTAAPSVHVRVE